MHVWFDMNQRIMSYALKHRGRWWANHFFRNREVDFLYQKIRALDFLTVGKIVDCGCSDWVSHVGEWKAVS